MVDGLLEISHPLMQHRCSVNVRDPEGVVHRCVKYMDHDRTGDDLHLVQIGDQIFPFKLE